VRIIKKICVNHPLGLHLRAAAKLVSMLSRFHCKVVFRKEEREAGGRSLLNLLALGAVRDTELEIDLDGEDAGEALAAIGQFFESGFFERESGGRSLTDLEPAGLE
jgi:phosphotransferase system HPr (HPr) family protein